jgi:hypothetical protein
MPEENKFDLKSTADELMKIPGKVRGEAILNRLNYIVKKEGAAGLTQVEEKLLELGYPIDIKMINSLGWYVEAQSILIIVVAREIFNWNEETIYDMGAYSPKISFIVKLLMNFVSLTTAFKAAPHSWSKHHSTGTLVAAEYNEEKKIIFLRLLDFKFHPLYCLYLRGYFSEIGRLIIYKGRNSSTSSITVTETKCTFKGDEYDEFKITW